MNRLSCEDDSALRYMDYAIIEQQTSMTAASAFWLDSLRDCKIHHHLSLPFDRHRVSDEHRTGRGISASFSFGEHLSRAFIVYASISKTTLENMALASYYAFLFKLTNGERDLCIGINTHGRYKPELMSIIGMFVNAIPLRCKLDPSWPFARLVKEVHQIAMDSSHYSYFPLQRILAQHPLVSKPAFLDTSFEFDSNTTQNMSNEIMLDDICLSLVPYSIKIETDEIVPDSFPSINCVHQAFTDRAMELSQKVAVELDDQSLTYSELLYYAQLLALRLLDK
ncbi:unnamed protein product [Rotaria sordida]|uniref:Condensation domain-containing protein n=1 Tax=Rotaria sordida TaxID=392033 RepID=A0A818XFT6_9BILA|nr:unnamed protein product [Rotaria sordida]